MKQTKLQKLIHETKGKFFSCVFRKADGTLRVANGKDKYFRLLAGGESTLEGTLNTPFIDRNKESWISANDERLLSFKCGKVQMTF